MTGEDLQSLWYGAVNNNNRSLELLPREAPSVEKLIPMYRAMWAYDFVVLKSGER